MNAATTFQELLDHKLVAVVRVDHIDQLFPVTEALLKGGIKLIEATLTIPKLLEHTQSLVQQFGDEMVFGIGSVLNAQMASEAIDAGANFIVSPVCDLDILKIASKNDILASVGAYSPSEIQQAWLAGSRLVKVFPADSLGPKYIKGVRAPMPHLQLMPTGGVSAENLTQWLDAGCAALGVGSALVDMKAVRSGDYEQIYNNAKQLTSILANWKSERSE